DLTIDDFEVLDEGQRRPLVSARFLAMPAVATPPVPAATIAGRREQILSSRVNAEAPVYVLLLDDLNVSPYDAHRAIRAGLGVVGAVPKDALLSVVKTSGDGGSLLTLTPPGDDHAAAVRTFRGQFLLSGPPANAYAPQTTPSSVDAPCGVGSAVDQSPDCADPTRAARRAGAIRAVGQLLAQAGSRRKVLFWLTTDMGVSPLDPKGNQSAQLAALHGVLGGDVTVYPVDPRENYVTPATPGGMDRRSGGRMRVGTADTQFGGPGGSAIALGTDDMVAVPLSQIARDTGGRWIQWTNNLETALATVVEQNTAAYILAFESTATNDAGRRRIEVKVRRRGARVSARRAYVVPADTAPVPKPGGEATTVLLQQTMRGAISQGTLAMRLHVAPQVATGAKGRVLVTLEVDRDAIGESPSVLAQLLVVDQKGQASAVQGVQIARPAGGEPMEGSITLDVPPGHHQLRVAAVTSDAARAGLVLAPLQVLTPREELTVGVPVLLSNDDRGVRPTIRRAAPSGAPLAIQVERASTALSRLTRPVRVRLIDDVGNVVRTATATDAAATGAVRTSTGVVDTAGLGAGNYRMVVDVPGETILPADGHVVPIRLDAPEATAPPLETAASIELTPLSVAHGSLTRHAHRGPLVITTDEAWTDFWQSLPTRQPRPDIDFGRVTLLAIVSPDEGTGPAMPRITRVRTEPGGVVVHWTRGPAINDRVGTELPRPFVVVGLTSTQGRVRFEEVD
ncbi:MAG TPA: VWA domain-containing protein, partial [Luteitalea sp.]|nr:VWA domain-containing protein [Luteitalea sp.]